MKLKNWTITLVLAIAFWLRTSYATQRSRSAVDLTYEIYDTCLKDLSLSCIKPKAVKWYEETINQNEIKLTENLAIIRTRRSDKFAEEKYDKLSGAEKIYENMENFLNTHALSIQPSEHFKNDEARNFLPDFLLNNIFVNGAVIPLSDDKPNESRGFMRKAVLPFLIGLKLKTTILMPLILAIIALKTWKAMTLGLLSLVLSGALVVFKIAKPKIVNYEVVHYPHHHVEHVVPHHIEHIVPHHLDHRVDHHLDHHVELPHVDHSAPTWDPHGWARSSQVPSDDAQDMAFIGQRKR